MWKYNTTPESDELMHYGVLGQKWGVRRSERQLARARKKAAKNEPDHEDYTKAHTPKSIRTMSNAELNDRNKRLNAEQQYKKLTKKTSTGKKVVNGIIATTATLTAVTAAATAINKFGDTFKPIVSNALDKAGDFVVKNLDAGLKIPIN